MNKTVLIYDDEESILEVIMIILEEHGYKVYTFLNRETIFDEVKKYSPDLILMDIWMKGTNGHEISLALKNDSKTKSIPVILISA